MMHQHATEVPTTASRHRRPQSPSPKARSATSDNNGISCAIESAGHFLICRFGSFLLLSKAQNVMRCGVSERRYGVTAFYQRYILLPTPQQYTFATMAMSFVVGDRRTQQENLHLAAEYWVHVHSVLRRCGHIAARCFGIDQQKVPQT
jgi:hypothetical protein